MYIELPNEPGSIPIFRIIPFNRLLDILVNSKITLVKPKFWDDPFENFLYKQPILTPNGETISIKKFEDSIFGNCWTYNSDNDFSWRVYAPHKDGIQIQSSIDILHNHLNDGISDNEDKRIKVGKVLYLTWDEIRDIYENRGGFSPIEFISSKSLFYKRIEFAAEKEVRVIGVNQDLSSNEVWQIDVDPNTLILKILIDPRISSNDARVFTEVIKKLGYTGVIEQSKLYASPKLNIQPK